MSYFLPQNSYCMKCWKTEESFLSELTSRKTDSRRWVDIKLSGDNSWILLLNYTRCLLSLVECGGGGGASKIQQQRCREYQSPTIVKVTQEHTFTVCQAVTDILHLQSLNFSKVLCSLQKPDITVDSEEKIKVYKNKDCAMCDDEEEGSGGNQGASFRCFNPYFSHKSSLRGKT